MAILSRIFRICKADIHGVMDQIEDHELLLKQYLREMEESLEEKATRLATLRQACSDVHKDISLRMTETDKLDKDIDNALGRDREDIARMLIRKRHSICAVCERLKSREVSLEMEKESLSEMLERQRLRYDELKVRATDFYNHSSADQMESIDGPAGDTGGISTTIEEEVELELLQRKEFLQQGGAVR